MDSFTNKQLNEICTAIINNCPREYPELAAFFTTAYSFGLRWVEIFELSRWKYLNEKEIEITTAKKGDTRIILVDDVERMILEMLDSNVSTWNLCRYNTIRYYAQHFSPYPFAVCKHKEIGVHIFRHTYIKNLYDLGFNIENIAKIMGEKDPKNIDGYVKSEIYPNF